MHSMNQQLLSYARRCVAMVLLVLLSAPGFAAPAAKFTHNLTLANGVEIPLTTFRAHGKIAMLWLPSERGLLPAEYGIAAQLARLGVEVWLADLHAAYFLPTVPSSLQQMPAADMAQLISAVQQRSHKPVYLITADKGAELALTAAAAWHGNPHDLRGAILLSPNLHVATPEPGEDAQFLPITTATHLPVYILQPELSALRWRVDQLQTLLEQGGAPVKVQLLAGVRDRFYLREDVFPAEQIMAAALPQLIVNATRQLKGMQP